MQKTIKTSTGLALVALVLCTFNLRAAYISLTSIYNVIAQDIPDFSVDIIGTLPILSFAIFGALAPFIKRKLGFQWALTVSMLLVFAGITLRITTDNFVLFVLYSELALAGMGFGNVLLPPTFKVYFPNHIGAVTSLYSVTVAFAAGIPSLLAVPVSDALGWKVNVAMWGAVGLAAAVPWFIMALQSRGYGEEVTGIYEESIPRESLAVYKWPVAWSLAVLFGIGGMLSMYSMLNWLPMYLYDVGYSHADAGNMLFLYNVLGVFHSLLVPLFIGKMKQPYRLIVLAFFIQTISYCGFLFAPQYAWAWCVVAAPAGIPVPAAFQLINLRTRTAAGAMQLSAFTQGCGYVFAAIGPFAVGHLLAFSGGWNVPFYFLMAMSFVMLLAGKLAVSKVYIEDARQLEHGFSTP